MIYLLERRFYFLIFLSYGEDNYDSNYDIMVIRLFPYHHFLSNVCIESLVSDCVIDIFFPGILFHVSL